MIKYHELYTFIKWISAWPILIPVYPNNTSGLKPFSFALSKNHFPNKRICRLVNPRPFYMRKGDYNMHSIPYNLPSLAYFQVKLSSLHTCTTTFWRQVKKDSTISNS